MKYNDKELARVSEEKSVIEGRLNYKKIPINNPYTQIVFKERWFKLIDNFLFYFRLNESGYIFDKQAVGAFVLENAIIQTENDSDAAFAFSIIFKDEVDKKHVFSCMSEKLLSSWVSKLQCASYEYLRSQLFLLQSRIFSKTGKDPLLMVPRNAGSMLWKQAESPTAKSSFSKSGFICHIEDKNYVTSVHRSKSSVNVSDKTNIAKDTSFFENSWPGNPKVERSKTSAQVFNRLNRHNEKLSTSDPHFNVMYHRSAPSPPPRKKNSPLLSRSPPNGVNHNLLSLEDALTHPPIPPQRKNSPRNVPDTSQNLPNKEMNKVNIRVQTNSPQKSKEVNLIDF